MVIEYFLSASGHSLGKVHRTSTAVSSPTASGGSETFASQLSKHLGTSLLRLRLHRAVPLGHGKALSRGSHGLRWVEGIDRSSLSKFSCVWLFEDV